jgi:hypothetical protein
METGEEGYGALPTLDISVEPQNDEDFDDVGKQDKKINGPRPTDPIKTAGMVREKTNVVAISAEEGELLGKKVALIAKLGKHLKDKKYVDDINFFFHRTGSEALPLKEKELLEKLSVVVDFIENTENTGAVETLSKQLNDFLGGEIDDVEEKGDNVFFKIISPYLTNKDTAENDLDKTAWDGVVLETTILGEDEKSKGVGEFRKNEVNGRLLEEYGDSLKKMSDIVDIINGRLSSGIISDKSTRSDGVFGVGEKLSVTENNKDVLENIKTACDGFSRHHEELLRSERLNPDSEEYKAFDRIKRLHSLIISRGELDSDVLLNRNGEVSNINDLFEGQEEEVRLLEQDFATLSNFHSKLMEEQGSHILFETNDGETLQSNERNLSRKKIARELAGAVFEGGRTEYAEEIVETLVRNEAISTTGGIDATKIPLKDAYGLSNIVKTFSKQCPIEISEEDLRATKNALKRMVCKLDGNLDIDGLTKITLPFSNVNAKNIFSLMESTLKMQSANPEDNMSDKEVKVIMDAFKRANKMWKVDIVAGKDGILIGKPAKSGKSKSSATSKNTPETDAKMSNAGMMEAKMSNATENTDIVVPDTSDIIETKTDEIIPTTTEEKNPKTIMTEMVARPNLSVLEREMGKRRNNGTEGQAVML